jgi:hypothetical protein
MPNANRPAGPTKPTHLVRENAIEREQIDEALGVASDHSDGNQAPTPGASGREGGAAADRGTPERSTPARPAEPGNKRGG